jgi:hypothetical protein
VTANTGVRVLLGEVDDTDSEREAEEVRQLLEPHSIGGSIPTKESVNIREGEMGVLPVIPVFVWIVVAAVVGAAGVAQIVIWIIQKTGCSAIVSDGPDGKLDIRKDCDIRGLVVLEQRDGTRTVFDKDLVNFTEILKAAAEKGVTEAAKVAQKAGAKTEEGAGAGLVDPTSDEGSGDARFK